MSNRKQLDGQEVCARRVRELAQSSVNRQCFECGQPGVTYTDITVGCFVCTSCSGLLRGLNPPHRVKSISMTTFTQQEVEFLQNRGNEVGKKTWLCSFDAKTDGCFDARDAPRLKEFLQDKYEKKKWHFSKNKSWKETEGCFSVGGQGLLSPPSQPSGQPASHLLSSCARPTRTLFQLSSWDRVPAVSPADLRTDAFTAHSSRSLSVREPPGKDAALSSMERQRPGTISPGRGGQSQAPPFPALPRPSGRTASLSGGSAPFRAMAKSLSVDFGGLSQHSGPSVTLPASGTQDRCLALSQLDSVFSDSSSPVTAPPSGASHNRGDLLSNRSSSSSTPPSSSPGLMNRISSPKVFASFPNPFSGSDAGSQSSPSPSNPFSGPLAGNSSKTAALSSIFPQSASFSVPSSQNAFAPQLADSQEANGFASFSASKSSPSSTRPVSVNPFTGSVYPSRVTSWNPFI